MNRKRSVAIGCVIMFVVVICASASAATPKIRLVAVAGHGQARQRRDVHHRRDLQQRDRSQDVKLLWSPSLKAVLKVDPSTFVGVLPAKTIATITLTVTIPPDAKRRPTTAPSL